MPLRSANADNGIPAKDRSGLRSCRYRDANYRDWDAVITGPGTNSGVKIRITSQGNRIVDDVPPATALHGAGSIGYHVRQL